MKAEPSFVRIVTYPSMLPDLCRLDGAAGITGQVVLAVAPATYRLPLAGFIASTKAPSSSGPPIKEVHNTELQEGSIFITTPSCFPPNV